MGDINPQIDLMYVCFLQGRVYNPLKNRKFHEVSAEPLVLPGKNHGTEKSGSILELISMPRKIRELI